MALNISLIGKVYDVNGVAIDATVDCFIYPQGVWNTAKPTELKEYTINLGDGDFLTQDGSVSVGDVVLVRVRSAEGIAVAKIVLSSDDLYLQDIQVKPIQPPNCTLSLSGGTTINRDVTATLASSDEYQWEFGGDTMYHKIAWYGTVVFDELGIATKEYDFEDGYQPSSTHQYAVVGSYLVQGRSTNKNGQQSVCAKQIEIRYNPPIGCLSFSPLTPILNDVVTVSACISDEDGRITSISHRFDGSMVASNTVKDFEYGVSVPEFRSYELMQIIRWNDGFDDKEIEFSKMMELTNQPPLAFFSYSNEGSDYLFTPECSDIDGTVEAIKWDVYFVLPFSAVEALVYSSEWVDHTPINMEFVQQGRYRVEITAMDDLGATASYSVSMGDIQCDGSVYDKIEYVYVKTISVDVCEPVISADIYIPRMSVELKPPNKKIGVGKCYK